MPLPGRRRSRPARNQPRCSVRQTNALMIARRLALCAGSGCSACEYVEVTPQRTPPRQPALPVIDAAALWDALGDAEYRQHGRYVNGLWGYADEQAALLSVLCAD